MIKGRVEKTILNVVGYVIEIIYVLIVCNK